MPTDPSLLHTRVVLLSGPPRSGKDIGAKHLARAMGAVRFAFADPLKTAVHASFGLFGFSGAPCPPSAFESVKDEPLEEFQGISPRRAYTAHAERYMRPLYGYDVYGRFLVRDLRRAVPVPALVAVPDAGNPIEAAPVLEALGRDRVLLVRVHRPGRGFADDPGRARFDLPGVRTIDLDNAAEGDPGPYLAALEAAVRGWVAGA